MNLRTIINKRADELNLSAFDLARLIRKQNGGWVVSTDHMERFFAGEKDMTSEKLDAVMTTLGLFVVSRDDEPITLTEEDGNR